MNREFSIRELAPAEMSQQWPLIQQLAPPDEKKENYERMLKEMLPNGYRMIGAFENLPAGQTGERCVGISGFWIGTKLYCGKYLEPDNVIIDKNYRSKGIGKLLMDWLTEEAIRNGCKTIMLDAYLENIQGHKFYWREGFVARGFHFLKKL